MSWDKNPSNLRNLLASLYWNVEEARRIVLEVSRVRVAYVHLALRSPNLFLTM